MSGSVATVFEWERYRYELSTRNSFYNGVFYLTPQFLDTLEMTDPDQKCFAISRDQIRAKQQVGVIKIDDFSIQVFPKLFKDTYENHKSIIARNLAIMLSYCEVPFSPVGMSDLDTDELELLEIFIQIYAINLLSLLSHNQSREYLKEQEPLRFVQERILTREYWNPAKLHIIPCQFHQFSQDTIINRTLKYCSSLMLFQTKNNRTISALKQILSLLEPVEYTPVTVHEVCHIQITRLNQQFSPFIKFCEFFLSHMTITLQAATSEIFSLVIPMERVFESFIAGVIANTPGLLPKGVMCKTQSYEGCLAKDQNNKSLFYLKPDIVFTIKKPLVVIDTKYKLLTNNPPYYEVKQSDIYQMYAYGAKTGAETILLLYPDSGESIALTWHMEYDMGKRADLLIRSITLSRDLKIEWDQFIEEITAIIQPLFNEQTVVED